jgi:LPXTG-site transpeptidase (sortase) family protein
MKFSSYAVISLFSITLGIVTIPPQIRYHSAASTPTIEPQLALEIPDSSSVHAAVSSDPTSTEPEAIQEKAPAAAPKKPSASPKKAESIAPAYPVQLSIPTIKLSSAVIPVGLNDKGEMAVPSGSTSNVGWYKGGVLPGNPGTAVMDAHVFAAFSKLDALDVGDDLYVQTADNQRLHFVVRATRTYALGDLVPTMLFQQTDARHLNLITCAGNLTLDRTTYDHRLIIYTELVS